MKALRNPLPGMLPRTIASPQTIPNTVFTATAIAVTSRVSLKAEMVSGAVIAAQAPSRSSAVRHTIMIERADEDHDEVAERDEAEPEPTHGRAS